MLIHASHLATLIVLLPFFARYRDLVTGLQYNRARWYDAHTGRWLSEDPIGFEAGDANLYRYVGNRPISREDPTGLVDPIDGTPGSGWYRYPDDPVGRWTPEEFFGEGSPLIYQTEWGCGGVAAWRAGVELNDLGRYSPFDIKKLPGAKPYNTLKAAVSAQKAIGKQGALIVARKIRRDKSRKTPGAVCSGAWT